MNVQQFNEAFPVGSRFKYQPIKGIAKTEIVTTRSYAWQLGHGEEVVKVEGRAGGVSLEHLTPVKEEV